MVKASVQEAVKKISLQLYFDRIKPAQRSLYFPRNKELSWLQASSKYSFTESETKGLKKAIFSGFIVKCRKVIKLLLVLQVLKTTIRFMFSIDVNRPKTALWILIICGFVLYANTLSHDFNLDDGYYTAGNKLTEGGWESIPGIFTIPTIYGPKGIGYDYRPVVATSFIIQHQLFGAGAGTSHLINLCLYLVTVVLLYRLLLEWLPQKDSVSHAFWICLLFLVHPLHTEVVTSIKSRDELMAFLFALLCLRFWIVYFKKQKIYLAFLAILFLILALFSKYTILPFLIFIPLALYFFYGLGWQKSLLVFTLLLAIAAGCHLVKSSILPPFDHYFSITENGLVQKEYGFAHRLATSFYVMGRYMLLHFFPVKLVYYYGYQYVPVVGWNNLMAVLSLMFYSLLAVWCMYNRHKKSLLLFGILLYLGHMIIYSNLVELAPGMMAERFTYAASFGFCIAVVLGVAIYLKPRIKGNTLLGVNGLFLFMAIVLASRTILRNQDWKNKEVLFSHDVKVAPQSAMLNYLYGDWLLASALEQKRNALAYQGYSPLVDQQVKVRISESQPYFKKALQINPSDTLAQYNLASSYIQLDDFKTAEGILANTVKQFPQYGEAIFTLGLSQVYQKKYAEAIVNFKKLLQIDPGFVIGYEQLNRAQLAIGDTSSALSTLSQAMDFNPSSPVPLAEMANYWLQAKDTVKAIGFAEKAAHLPPPNQGLLLFLKNYFFVKGDRNKADYYFSLLKQAAPL
jgi:tetratricopeptide (TPR) repeat protein